MWKNVCPSEIETYQAALNNAEEGTLCCVAPHKYLHFLHSTLKISPTSVQWPGQPPHCNELKLKQYQTKFVGSKRFTGSVSLSLSIIGMCLENIDKNKIEIINKNTFKKVC